jgi:hypothetical protein
MPMRSLSGPATVMMGAALSRIWISEQQSSALCGSSKVRKKASPMVMISLPL